VKRIALLSGRRLLHLVIVLFLISVGSFFLLHVIPGNPAAALLGTNATPASVRKLDRQLGLDQPLIRQYGHWLWGVLHGNFGTALSVPQIPVWDRISPALPVSIEIALLAVIMALVVAIPVAIFSAYRESGFFDRFSSTASFGLLSMPAFVTGLVLALLFTLDLRIFPRTQWVALTASVPQNLYHAFLPALTLALTEMAVYTRILRTDMIGTLKEEYIRFAQSKGLSVRYVLFRHALRPSSISLVTLSGVSLGRLIGGTVIVEVIFGLPGMGNLLVGAVGASDYPLVLGIVVTIAVIYVMINLVTDLSYGFLDARTRHGRT
jgi:peptide/nickel transport system permease protein